MIDIETDIDIFTEQKIQIVRRVKDYSDISAKESEFSRTFQGPASAKNQRALQNYGILGTSSDFDPHKGIACVWSFSTFAKFTGRLEVVSVTYKDGKPYSFTFNFYGRQRSLANVFGADRFSDIDWSEFDHRLTYDNVNLSWFGLMSPTGGPLEDTDLLYPLIDSRANYYFGPTDQNIEGNVRNPSNPILLTDLKPAIRIAVFLKRIFTAYRLTLKGSLVDPESDDYLSAYILPNRWSGSGVAPDTFNNNVASYEGGFADNPYITTPDTDQIITLPDLIQDDNGLFDGTTYTANVLGDHSISGNFTIQLDGDINPGKYRISIRKNGVEEVGYSFLINTDQVGSVFSANIPSYNMTLDIGDEVEFFLVREPRVIGPITFNGNDCRVFVGYAFFEAPPNILGQLVSLNDQMPDDKIVDWLGSFAKSLNLVLVPSNDTDTEWTIQSVRNYYAEGVKRDWKGYIDIENMTFTKPKVYKEIKMGFTPTDAAVQKAFTDATGRNFGEITINPDVEFGEPKLEVRNPCTIIPPALFKVVDAAGIPTGEFTDVTIHKSLNIEGNPVKEPWLLFYYNGIGATAFTYYLQDGFTGTAPSGVEKTIYPHISAVDAFNPTSDTITLCYSLESALNGVVSENTSYQNYWEEELLIQYAKDSRVLQKARVVLPTLEFYNYQLNDEIFLENTWWRIDEISHDQDGKNAVVTLSSSRKLTPTNQKSVQPGGKILFTDPPSPLEKSAAGAYQKSGSFYGSFVRAQITPNLSKYGDVVNSLTQIFINEINDIGGRFRSWDDETPES